MMSTEDCIRAALPGYDIGEQVGRGGCGVVLSGFHRGLQRPVAIKQIPAQFVDDTVARRRFVTEARLMAAIDHPHVVPVYDYVEHRDLCLLVLEYLPGGTVADRFATKGFDAASALAIALSCAAGLEAAHRHAVLHRDIKPSNLLFTESGTVKLTDFGIAKIVGGDETLMTLAGEAIGTPSYIAPEQARGQSLSAATDVYALATMLYQLLSGVLPFPPGEDQMATLFMHAFEKPTPLTAVAPAVPEPIAGVVMRGLATDPIHRFGSAEAFGIALAESAADRWGADWLAPVGIPVIGADTIHAAATGYGHHADTVAAPRLPIRKQVALSGLTTRVRPAESLPRPRVELSNIRRSDVAPIQDVTKFRSPRIPFTVAAMLGLAAVAVALIGLGAPPRGGDLPPGVLTIAGTDPTMADAVDIDMSAPIPMTVNGTPGSVATLGLDVLGTSLGRHSAPLAPGTTSLMPPPVNPHLLAGTLTGELSVDSGETTPITYRFGIQSTQSALATALAVASVVMALFAVAYVESYIRTLRRGRSRFSGSFGLPLSATALAVAIVGAVWVLLGQEPTRATVIGCAALGAASGIAATFGAMRIGRKFRYRRTRAARM